MAEHVRIKKCILAVNTPILDSTIKIPPDPNHPFKLPGAGPGLRRFVQEIGEGVPTSASSCREMEGTSGTGFDSPVIG